MNKSKGEHWSCWNEQFSLERGSETNAGLKVQQFHYLEVNRKQRATVFLDLILRDFIQLCSKCVGTTLYELNLRPTLLG